MTFAPHILDEIRARIPVSRVVERRVKLKRVGREYTGLSPFKRERTPSFTVNDHKGFYHCFATGEHGDIFKFLMTVDGMTFPDAVRMLAGEAGVSLGDSGRAGGAGREMGRAPDLARAAIWEARRIEREAAEAADRARRRETARGIWDDCEPGEGTLVETYLRARGINCEALADVYGWTVPPSLRFCADLDYFMDGVRWRGPAMVGAVTGAAGELVAVHRTWLEPDGSWRMRRLPKNKLCLGVVGGGLGVLSEPASRGVMGEGYETTLTVLGALATRGERWWGNSGLNLGNMAGPGAAPRRIERDAQGYMLPSLEPDMTRPWLPIPREVKSLTLLQDMDGKSPLHADRLTRRAAARAIAEGLRASIAHAEKRKDFNDMAEACI